MGKRSEFERNHRDFYPTPKKAVLCLKGFLQNVNYIEPCAGDGRLINHLKEIEPTAKCVFSSDIHPLDEGIQQKNVFEQDWESFVKHTLTNADCFVTNPPWENKSTNGYQLNNIIGMLSSVLPTWLLMNGNFAFNKRSAPYMRMCTDIVPIGRLKWIEDSPHSGKEDCAWFRFDNTDNSTKITYFHPREN